MATKVIGKLDDWTEADLGGNDFMKLEEGNNPVRVFTSPYQFYTVWTKDAAGKQRKIRSAVENCPLVQRGEKPVARWYIGVINRKNGKPCILEIGPQIYKQILSLRKKPAWGDPRHYDIDVERKPRGEQPLYVVAPEPKEPLTDEEKSSIKEFLSRVDLVKMTEAPTPEEVRIQLGEMEPSAGQTASVNNDFDDFDSPKSSDSDDDFNF